MARNPFAALATASVVFASPLSALDTDTNGMCDVWQARYHAAALAPGDDADGDGFDNATEAIAGTDPFDPRSLPAVAVDSISAAEVALAAPAQPGKRYEILTSPDVSGPITPEVVAA